jgi:hypothetical protein
LHPPRARILTTCERRSLALCNARTKGDGSWAEPLWRTAPRWIPSEGVSLTASPSRFSPPPLVPGLFWFRARVILLPDRPTRPLQRLAVRGQAPTLPHPEPPLLFSFPAFATSGGSRSSRRVALHVLMRLPSDGPKPQEIIPCSLGVLQLFVAFRGVVSIIRPWNDQDKSIPTHEVSYFGAPCFRIGVEGRLILNIAAIHQLRLVFGRGRGIAMVQSVAIYGRCKLAEFSPIRGYRIVWARRTSNDCPHADQNDRKYAK